MFFLTNKEILQLNHLTEPKEYTIQVGTKQFKYSRSQLPFLSNSILQYFEDTHQHFFIDYSSSLKFSLEDLISCFASFDYLFRNNTDLLIEYKNVLVFTFIAQSLRNYPLLHACNKVSSTKSKIFSLNSEYLGDISLKQLPFMNNFTLYLNERPFEINSCYFSLLSNKIHSLDKSENQLICSIPDEHLFCFESFLSIFKGSSFRFNAFDLSSLLYLIDYFDLKSLPQFISDSIPLPTNLEESISFLSKNNNKFLEKHIQKSIDILIENIKHVSINQFLEISNENLLFIFNSSKLLIRDEDFLFTLIVQLIEQDFSKKILLPTIYFPLVSSNLLKSFFQHFPVEEIDVELFEKLKERLFIDVLFSESIKSSRYQNQPNLITKSEIEETSKILQNYFQKPVKMNESTQELITQVQSQEQLISSLQKEIQQFKSELKDLKTQNSTFQQELKNEKNEFINQKKQFEKEISNLKNENESLKVKSQSPTILPPHQQINFNGHNAIISFLRSQNQNFVKLSGSFNENRCLSNNASKSWYQLDLSPRKVCVSDYLLRSSK
jgi:hypothetical protein